MTHPLRTHLDAVATALCHPDIAVCACGGIDAPDTPPKVKIAPPVDTTALEALETRLERRLPATLIEVLTQVTADLSLFWSFPCDRTETRWGYDYTQRVTPPDEVMDWSVGFPKDSTPPPHAVRKPVFTSGGLNFGLSAIEKMSQGFPWRGSYDYMRDVASDDPEECAHWDFIEDFMARGLPVLSAKNGDWLAIDLGDERERLIHVSHEGESAGLELDLTLPQFLTHMTWLGPLHADTREIMDFSTAVTETVPGDFRIKAVRFDAESTVGTIWRGWFWQGVPLPRPAEELLARS